MLRRGIVSLKIINLREENLFMKYMKSILIKSSILIIFISVCFPTSALCALVGGGIGGGSKPSTPTLYEITSPNYNGSVKLSWSYASGATSYKVYRYNSETGSYKLIKTTSSRSYTDTRPEGTWYYTVRAYNYYGYSSFSNEASVEVVLNFISFYHYDDENMDTRDRDTWDADYTSWIENSTRTSFATGIYPGNYFSVSFVPAFWRPMGDYYYLQYGVNVHVETNMGDVEDEVPQPTMGLDPLYYERPFVIDDVRISAEFVQIQSDKTNMEFYDTTCNTFLGDYYYTCPQRELTNYVCDGYFSNEDCWESYGMSSGIISISDSYVRPDGLGGGVKIVNNDGGSMGVKNKYDISLGSGRRDVTIQYWGKRSSSESGNEAGVKLLIEYYDGTTEWVFPDNLQLYDCSNTWRKYQYTFEASQDIKSILPYAFNDEEGTVYISELFIPYGYWQFETKGDWISGNYNENSYQAWLDQMEAIEAHNNCIDHIATAIEVCGLISDIIAIFAPEFVLIPSTLVTAAGFLLNALKKEVPSTIIRGNEDKSIDFTEFNFGTDPIYIDGVPTTTVACDCSLSGKADFYRNDVDNAGHRSIAITVEVDWSSPSETLQGRTDGIVFDTASTTLIIDLSKFQYVP